MINVNLLDCMPKTFHLKGHKDFLEIKNFVDFYT